MKTEKLDYYLPEELIAQHPSEKRDQSRLLVLNRVDGSMKDGHFSSLPELLRKGDCLVLNDTKVLSARFFGHKLTGGAIEGLFLRETSPSNWLVMLKGSRKLKAKETIILEDVSRKDFCRAVLIEKMQEGRCILNIERQGDCESILEEIGLPPLPPYIKRDRCQQTAQADRIRYQTVYAKQSGAVAAPTAGLHFTDNLLGKLRKMGVITAKVTLHVGAGTFKPVTAENLEDHEIHQEWLSIDSENAEIVNQTKRNGGRIIAVGTTSVRTLETVAKNSLIEPFSGMTELFITPGYKYKIVDAMITNFHLPKSTLLALVGAFAGLDNVIAAYQHAIKHKYRFYSYGDAMLIM